LKTTNCTFQEVNNIFCFAVGIAVYDEFFFCMCAAEFLCEHCQNIVENGIIPKLIKKKGPPQCGIYTLGQ
jgi:hypothetical protein